MSESTGRPIPNFLRLCNERSVRELSARSRPTAVELLLDVQIIHEELGLSDNRP